MAMQRKHTRRALLFFHLFIKVYCWMFSKHFCHWHVQLHFFTEALVLILDFRHSAGNGDE
jgi:hypothetical protein